MVVPIASVREAAEIGLLLVPDYVHVVPGFREVRQDIEQSINRQLIQPALMLSAPGATQLRGVRSLARLTANSESVPQDWGKSRTCAGFESTLFEAIALSLSAVCGEKFRSVRTISSYSPCGRVPLASSRRIPVSTTASMPCCHASLMRAECSLRPVMTASLAM